MSSVTLMSTIIVLLTALVCYALSAHSLARRRQYKERMLAALKQRTRNLQFILNSSSAAYLPKELILLVQRSLIKTYEQLARIEPKHKAHLDQAKSVAQSIVKAEDESDEDKHHPPKNPQQILEIKACLEQLHKLILQLEAQSEITRQQGEAHRSVIKQLVLKLSVDSHVLRGQDAQKKHKPRLTLHYYDLAIKLMERNGGAHHLFEQKIEHLRQVMVELEKSNDSQPPVAPTPSEENGSAGGERMSTRSERDSWKKKQIYD